MSALADNPLWRLLLGNPIFVRVVEMSAKRTRHALIRIGYLAVLVLVAVIGLLFLGAGQGGTLTELSRASAKLFTAISFAQLGMACLMAPIFTAGAITQEKDNDTYHVLLATPLSNAQIVLGSLVSRLYFVLALLASGIPIFLITQLYGGVTGGSILLSFMIAAATAIFTGALAIAIAVLRVGTGKTIFAFYIFIGLYMAVMWFVGDLRWFRVAGADTGWLTALHPFLSLQVVLNMTHAPDPASLRGAGWLTRLWLCTPHYAYLAWTLLSSAAMIGLGTIFVRSTATRTRVDWRRKLRAWLTGGATTRKPRGVWANPVAWREAATRASAGGKSVMRWLFLIGGLTAGGVLLGAYLTGVLTAGETRAALTAVLWVELSVVLLVLCNVSASAITREREDGTLDLLLVTPITSRYYIWGKLRGLISFSAVLLIVPVGTVAMFAAASLLTGHPVETIGYSSLKAPVPLAPVEAVAELALTMLALSAFTVMIALTMSLKVRTTIAAVLWTVTVVATAALGASACGFVSVRNLGYAGPAVVAASPYVAAAAAIAPHEMAENSFSDADMTMPVFRSLMLIMSVVATGVYALIVWGMYNSMVKSFDMIIRRQSR